MQSESASADTYTLTITNGDEVFCTLTFDSFGRLSNLDFPNLRSAVEGYQFTTTGLKSATDYAYSMKVQEGTTTQKEYTGEFRTTGETATSVENVEAEKNIKGVWTVNGQYLDEDAEKMNLPAGVYIIDGDKKAIAN